MLIFFLPDIGNNGPPPEAIRLGGSLRYFISWAKEHHLNERKFILNNYELFSGYNLDDGRYYVFILGYLDNGDERIFFGFTSKDKLFSDNVINFIKHFRNNDNEKNINMLNSLARREALINDIVIIKPIKKEK